MSTTLIAPSTRPAWTVRTSRTIRLQASDCNAAIAMLGRCSGATLRRRFHGVTDGVRYVTSLIGSGHPTVGYGAWIDGRCVGIASLHLSEQASAEMAVLVEDDWQQRGIGTALVAALATAARQRGLTTLTATLTPRMTFWWPPWPAWAGRGRPARGASAPRRSISERGTQHDRPRRQLGARRGPPGRTPAPGRPIPPERPIPQERPIPPERPIPQERPIPPERPVRLVKGRPPVRALPRLRAIRPGAD